MLHLSRLESGREPDSDPVTDSILPSGHDNERAWERGEWATGFSLGSGPIVFEQPAEDRHRRESPGDLGQDEGRHVLRHDAAEGIGEASG